MSLEFSRQEYWSGQTFPSPEDLPHPGIKPRSPALQADSLLSEPPGKPWYYLELGKSGAGRDRFQGNFIEWKSTEQRETVGRIRLIYMSYFISHYFNLHNLIWLVPHQELYNKEFMSILPVKLFGQTIKQKVRDRRVTQSPVFFVCVFVVCIFNSSPCLFLLYKSGLVK